MQDVYLANTIYISEYLMIHKILTASYDQLKTTNGIIFSKTINKNGLLLNATSLSLRLSIWNPWWNLWYDGDRCLLTTRERRRRFIINIESI